MEILESSIAVLFILFVLSQIAERLTNILKLWLHNNLGVENLRLRMPEKSDADKEKLRERRITSIALIVGILLAFIIKVDLKEILQIAINTKVDPTQPNNVVKLFGGWSSGDLNMSSIIGCTLTGIFLSFGSKWWHDLLELLLEFKNIKRNIAENIK